MAQGFAKAAGAGAPTDAKYIVQTSDAALSAEQALDVLATGLLKVATGTGILTTAIDGTDFVSPAGTATLTNKTFDANAIGNSLSNVDVADLANGIDGELITWDAAGVPTTVNVGTAAQVLTSNGVGAAPTFEDAAGGGGIVLQVVKGLTNGTDDSTLVIPNDGTLPQSSEGKLKLSNDITAASGTNIIQVDVLVNMAVDSGATTTVALFLDSEVGARAAIVRKPQGQNILMQHLITFFLVAGDTAQHTWNVRIGASAGTWYFNRGASGNQAGGKIFSSTVLTELLV